MAGAIDSEHQSDVERGLRQLIDDVEKAHQLAEKTRTWSSFKLGSFPELKLSPKGWKAIGRLKGFNKFTEDLRQLTLSLRDYLSDPFLKQGTREYEKKIDSLESQQCVLYNSQELAHPFLGRVFSALANDIKSIRVFLGHDTEATTFGVSLQCEGEGCPPPPSIPQSKSKGPLAEIDFRPPGESSSLLVILPCLLSDSVSDSNGEK